MDNTHLSIKSLFLFLCLSFIFFDNVFAQATGSSKGWIVKNPFDHKVFIENKGQFDSCGSNDSKILFGAQMGNVWIYFSYSGVILRYTEFTIDEEKHENDDEEVEHIKPINHTVNEEWKECNTSVSLIGEQELSYYYTYPTNNNTTIKTNIYKKILYKNLYQNIDVEYSFPKDSNGFEYSIILHPGADISNVKLQFNGIKSMEKDYKGNTIITTVVGVLTDHIPKSNYQSESKNLPIISIIDSNKLTFKAFGEYNKSKTVIIDPWVTDPLFSGNDKAYYVDYDNQGNVYAYGGYGPLQLIKLNYLGVVQWICNAYPLGYLGDFALDKHTGESYITQAANSAGAKVEKVSPWGVLLGTYSGNPDYSEFWLAKFDECNGKVIIGAGGLNDSIQAAILDTSMSVITALDVFYVSVIAEDICLMCLDPTNTYCYMADVGTTLNTKPNCVVQLPLPWLSPTSYIKNDNFKFKELTTFTFTNAMSGMASSLNWLYMYDGMSLKRFNKNTGIINDSIAVSGTPFKWGGLDVDFCDNIFAGCNDSIFIYDSSLIKQSSIALPDTIYDLIHGQNNLLYACGKGFVTQLEVSPVNSPYLSFQIEADSCNINNGSAKAILNLCSNSDSNFSYLWSNGQSTQTITRLSAGVYSVIVSIGCNPVFSDSVVIPSISSSNFTLSLSTDTICSGDSVQLSASGGTNYFWSNGATSSSIILSPTNTETITVKDSNACGDILLTKVIHVFTTPIVGITTNFNACKGQGDTIIVSGGTNYLWSNGSTLSSIIAIINSDTSFSVRVFNGNCYKDTTISIKANLPPNITLSNPVQICEGDSTTLIATGGGTYFWSNGATTSTIIIAPSTTTLYSVTVNNGCTASAATSVLVDSPALYVCCDTNMKNGDTSVIWADSSNHYKWLPVSGLNCDTCKEVKATPTITTTYTLTGTDSNGCTIERIITVMIEIPCTDLEVPNVFTPNGDGRNDLFEIKASDLNKYSIIIYDRWGKQIFKSTNPTDYWDGTTEGGSKAPDGVYYYILNATCQGITYKKDGFVQVIR